MTQETVATLPAAARAAFRDPLGDVYTDVESLLAGADPDAPLIAVGDVVVYHLVEAGERPDVAVVDERTEREAVDPEIADRLAGLEPSVAVPNDPGTLSAELLDALADAVARADGTVVRVDGEEDLAAVPAVLLAPAGASVVYGQPGEGMVRVPVSAATRARARDLAARLEGGDRVLSLVR